jgi:hypothetical protein
MTGNTFAPAAVEHAIELIRSSRTDVRATIHREFPELTRIGLDRVIDIAQEEIAERDGGDAAREMKSGVSSQPWWISTVPPSPAGWGGVIQIQISSLLHIWREQNPCFRVIVADRRRWGQCRGSLRVGRLACCLGRRR